MLYDFRNDHFPAKVVYCSLLILLFLTGCNNHDKHETIIENFKNPPADCLPAVYWFWNGEIDSAGIESQLREMKNSNTVGTVCILAWEGLTTEYLSDRWFEKVRFACKIAREVGLDIWLYDELRWPSGHAGGNVLKSNPEYVSKCLSHYKLREKGPKKLHVPVNNKSVAVIAARLENNKIIGNSLTDISDFVLHGESIWSLPEGDWEIHVFNVEECSFRTTFTNLKYVDLLNKQAVDTFISMTYDGYYKRMPEYFGTVIKAIITDEPGVYCGIKEYLINPQTIPWTDSLFYKFSEIKGYDLQKYLPALWDDDIDISTKVRSEFYTFYSELFQKTYFKALRDWCDNHQIKINIQPSHEETLKYSTRMMGNYFDVMKYSNLPGADEVYFWDKDNITPILASSAARSFGYKSTYCEVFAAYGWDMTLEKMKGITDWLYTRGINRLQMSAYYFSMNGNWRFEIPPSLFNQNPFWKYLPTYTDYVSRLTSLLSGGQKISQIAVLYPIQTAMGKLNASDDTLIDNIDSNLIQLSAYLMQNQLNFDFIDEKTLKDKISIIKKEDKTLLTLRSGDVYAAYDVLILPHVSVLSNTILEQINQFVFSGGNVIALGTLPKVIPQGDRANPELLRIWEKLHDRNQSDSSLNSGRAIFIKDHFDGLGKRINQIIIPDVYLNSPNKHISYIHIQKDDLDIYFISNSDTNHISTEISFSVKGDPQIWDVETGNITGSSSYRFEDERTHLSLDLSGYSSRMVVFDKSKNDILVVPSLGNKAGIIKLKDHWEFSFHDSVYTSEIRRSGSWTEPQILKVNDGSTKALAHPYFSGTAIYQQYFHLDHSPLNTDNKYILDAGVVKNVLEVILNGKKAGVRCWPPYQLDITDYLIEGENHLQLLVTNTMANRYKRIQKQYPTGEQWGKVLPSGLMNPVQIQIYDSN